MDEEVEKGREDEEGAAKLQAEVTAFQEECTADLAAAEPIIKVRMRVLLLLWWWWWWWWLCVAAVWHVLTASDARACVASRTAAVGSRRTVRSASDSTQTPNPRLPMQEAEAALNSLDKSPLGELKSFGSPAAEIVQVGHGALPRA